VSTVPLIYAHHRPQPKLSVIQRIIAGVASLLCLTVLIIAARLHPEPSGIETHLQLGLQPCGLLRTTGVPCPTCGMTTSFSFLAHGQILHSLGAQPAGTVFAFFAAMAVWIGLYIALTGRPSAKLFNQLPVHRVFLGMMAIGLVGWAYKIAVVWHSTHA
jgi:hypothetical protein